MPCIRILSGTRDGEVVPVKPDGDTFIGKQADCEVLINDAGVSRKHSRIFPSGDGLAIEDLESANGTYVNFAKKTKDQPTPLQDGDIMFIGRTVAKFYAGDRPPDAGSGNGNGAAAKELEQARAWSQELERQLADERDKSHAPAPAGGLSDEDLRALARGTIPIHGLGCPSCKCDLEPLLRDKLKEREQLEVVRKLALHRLSDAELEKLLAKARA